MQRNTHALHMLRRIHASMFKPKTFSSIENQEEMTDTKKKLTFTYAKFTFTHRARLLGRVQGVVVQATKAALSGSPTIGKDTIISGSGTSYITQRYWKKSAFDLQEGKDDND